MSTHIFIDQVLLMKALGFPVASGVENKNLASLYLKLLCEEVGETLIAANPVDADEIKILVDLLSRFCTVDPDCDKVEMFDGVIDTMVIAAGVGMTMGFPMQEGWDEVLRSNMAKVDPVDGVVRRREDGKVMKPEGWEPPNLARVISEN